jgi:16S rRNA (cytosine1402-N4)-methyltransferase
MTNNYEYHIPVMLQPCLDGLNMKPDGVYVDVTFGGGGHSIAIFEKLGEKGKLISFDQDPDARANTWEDPRFHFVASNFSFLKNQLRALDITKVDGILADLGVSSHQFDASERGFSIRGNDKLDMRMNQQGELTALTILHDYTEQQLAFVIGAYGEVDHTMRTVRAILRAREAKKLRTTSDLCNALESAAPKHKEHKFFAQVFQAIRIEVNQEMEVLKKMLEQTAEVLNPEGRLVVMSYHSLEDRLVKNFMKRGSMDGKIEKDFFGNVLKPFEEITRKPTSPTEEEIQQNTRSRSAKLRIAKRLKN